MPKGIYKHKKGYKRPPFSEEWKRKIGEAQKGRKLPPGHPFFIKGRLPWNKGLEGFRHSGSFKKGHKGCNIPSGKNCWNWKGGDKRGRHDGVNYNNWVKKVFEYDDYICWTCERKGGKLQAHHLKKWAEYPELRHVFSNGITLCEKCHKLYTNYGNQKSILHFMQQSNQKV
jgi:5-methylcytosine-specific restriction endonuclease McrA